VCKLDLIFNFYKSEPQDIEIDDQQDGEVNTLNISSLRLLLHHQSAVDADQLEESVTSLSNLDDSDSSKYLVRKKVQESLENLKEEAVVPKRSIRWELGSSWIQHLQKQEILKDNISKKDSGNETAQNIKALAGIHIWKNFQSYSLVVNSILTKSNLILCLIFQWKSKFYGFDKKGNRWKERTAGTVKFPKNKVTSKDLPTESGTVIPYVHLMKQAHKILRTVISPRLICSKLLRVCIWEYVYKSVTMTAGSYHGIAICNRICRHHILGISSFQQKWSRTFDGCKLVDYKKYWAVSELTLASAEVSEIVFFLLGAKTIVEIVDAHQGFKLVTDNITTRKPQLLFWVAFMLDSEYEAHVLDFGTAMLFKPDSYSWTIFAGTFGYAAP
ncbi:hypothetical protein S83_053533, partial [Arachis hypogaea]